MTTRRWVRKWYEKQKLQRFHSCFILEVAEGLDESADPKTKPDDDDGLWLSGDAFTFTPLELIQNSPLDLIGSKDDFLRVERCLRKMAVLCQRNFTSSASPGRCTAVWMTCTYVSAC